LGASSWQTSYRVNWGTGQGSTNAAGDAVAFPAKVFTQPGVSSPSSRASTGVGNPIAGSDAPLAFDSGFGDHGRV